MAAAWLYDTVQSIIEATCPEARGVRDWHAFAGTAPPKVLKIRLKEHHWPGKTVVVGRDWLEAQLALVVEEFNQRVSDREITQEQFLEKYDIVSD